jgi:hypothetical protein
MEGQKKFGRDSAGKVKNGLSGEQGADRVAEEADKRGMNTDSIN